MSLWRSALLRRQVRVVIYLLIVGGLFLMRGPQSWRDLLRHLNRPTQQATDLTVAGRDLAPALMDALTATYAHDDPAASFHLRGGGTNHALQALLDGDANVAVLARPPRAEEKALFVDGHRGPPLCEPIALGALVLFVADAAPVDSLAWPGITSLLRGTSFTPPERIYGEDPNLGIWDAFLTACGIEADAVDDGSVAFLADRAALLAAVRADPAAVGLASSFTFAVDDPPEGIHVLAVHGRDGPAAVRPTYEDTAHGRYPLLHHLYVACEEDATGAPAMFVTFVLSGRGQRRVERAGFLPARQVPREILLDDAPIGTR